MSTLTPEQADIAYTILCEQCGASPDEPDRASFCQYVTSPDQGFGGKEWRFCGKLGFGGKFYATPNGVWVSCYPEDVTDERRAMIERANTLLQGSFSNAYQIILNTWGDDPPWKGEEARCAWGQPGHEFEWTVNIGEYSHPPDEYIPRELAPAVEAFLPDGSQVFDRGSRLEIFGPITDFLSRERVDDEDLLLALTAVGLEPRVVQR